MRRAAAAALIALLALAAWTASAAAATDLEVAFEDERIMLGQPERAAAMAAEWAALGVQAVRLHARWSAIAPATARGRRYHWAPLDHAVAEVRAQGMKVQLTITGPGPLWTSREPGRGLATWKPDPRRFAAFSARVAHRYRGQIARYLVWNEPNIKGWLMPQATCRRGGCSAESPHLYRGLVRAAEPAIKAADPGAPVLIGELAPIGEAPTTSKTTIAPLPFLRALACVDARYRPVHRGPCARFEPAAADGFGHHPHGRRAAPTTHSTNPGWAKFADLPRLEGVLDRLTRARRLIAPGGRLDIWLTEFAYQTSAPDFASGVTVGHQDAWLQEASYMAWRDPRIRSLTFYQWEDEPVRWRGPGSLAYAGWQSGLTYIDGSHKPAYDGFVAPFVVDAARKRVWGQVRPGGEHTVTVERASGSGWSAVATAATDASGSFLRSLDLRRGERLRMRWSEADVSGSVAVPARGLAAPSSAP